MDEVILGVDHITVLPLLKGTWVKLEGVSLVDQISGWRILNLYSLKEVLQLPWIVLTPIN